MVEFELIDDTQTIDVDLIEQNETIEIDFTDGISSYKELPDKPSINNVELNGNKTSNDLGLQDKLISGTNIKTINNETILGSGNIDIQAGDSYYDASYIFESTILTQAQYDSLVDAIINKTRILVSQGSESYDVFGKVYDEQTGDIMLTITVGTVQQVQDVDYPIEIIAKYEINGETKEVTSEQGYIDGAEIAQALDEKADKSTTYTKDEVDELLAELPSLPTEVVQTLPQTGESGKIYLVLKNPQEQNDIYNEYLWINNNWEFIGTTQVDLTDYVKNTDYANENKGGVIRTYSGYGTGVNQYGRLYALDKTYSQYNDASVACIIGKGTLENVIAGKELVNQTTLDESQAVQDKAINDITVDMLGIGLKGNIEQDSTTGKNLFDLGSLNGTTLSGVTLTQDTDGGFLLNGTATNDARFRVTLTTELTQPISLYLKTPDNNGNIMLVLRDSNGTLLANVRNHLNQLTVGTYTGSTNVGILELAQITAGTTYTNYKIYPMVVSGTYNISTIGDYEPYTNGASPNPDYPQDIKVVTGDNEIKISNKNMLPNNVSTQTKNGITVTKNSDGGLTFNGTSTSGFGINADVNLTLPAGTYKFSMGNIETLTIPVGIYFSLDNASNTILGNAQGSERTIRLSEEKTYSKLTIWIDDGCTLNNLKVYPMFSVSGLPYVEHQEQNYPINLGDMELCKIGDYQDYIYYDSGKWYKHAEIGKVVLDGSETGWWVQNNQFRKSLQNSKSGNCKSNYFAYGSSDMNVNVYSDGYVYFKYSYLDNDLDDWKTWLGTHNTEVYYVLETPTNTEITDSTLITQLNALNKATSYGEDVITQTNAELPFELSYDEHKEVDITEQLENYYTKEINNTFGGIFMPDTTNMKPINTIEYDVSSNRYFKFMSIQNNFADFDEIVGDCLFRITVTGPSTNIVEGYMSLRNTTNCQPYLIVRNRPGEGVKLAGNTGIRYLRYIYPKALNNGYNWELEFNPINNTERHIKIEIFRTTNNIIWYDSLTDSTLDSTHQTSASFTLSTTDSINVLGTFNMTVSTATSASYLSSYLPKFPAGTLPKAGEAILAQQFIFFSDDNSAYPSSNTTKPIRTGVGIQLSSNAVNHNSAVPNTGLRQKYNNSTLTHIPHATLTAGDECWFRCTMDANGNIYSDNYVDTERRPGYTWYFVGIATSSSAINTDTTQSKFYTLDANGKLTHIDGLEIA